MFNGSENAPGDYFDLCARSARPTSTAPPGSTAPIISRPCRPRRSSARLFLESDRMGHLLGAVTQEKLDNQIGVVQNEKRQGDNEPYGLVEYAQLEGLFPEGHPYRHSTIGSMADLDAATLDDVRDWFRDKYGPNNAVLVLAGDINAAEARPLVERYFGDIPRGPVNTPAAAAVPTLPRPRRPVMHDRVANDPALPQLGRARPARSDQRAALDVGGVGARRPRQLAARQRAGARRAERGARHRRRPAVPAGQHVRGPGRREARRRTPTPCRARLDAIIADFVANGPTEDEVRRAVMRDVSGRDPRASSRSAASAARPSRSPRACSTPTIPISTRTLDQLARGHAGPGPRGDAALADPAGRSRSASIRASARPMRRPAYRRHAGQRRRPAAAHQPPRRRPAARAGRCPPIGVTGRRSTSRRSSAPASRTASRSVYARRTAVPVTRVAVEFDAGIAADPADRLGTQALMLNLLEEGTTSLNSEPARRGAGAARRRRSAPAPASTAPRSR